MIWIERARWFDEGFKNENEAVRGKIFTSLIELIRNLENCENIDDEFNLYRIDSDVALNFVIDNILEKSLVELNISRKNFNYDKSNK